TFQCWRSRILQIPTIIQPQATTAVPFSRLTRITRACRWVSNRPRLRPLAPQLLTLRQSWDPFRPAEHCPLTASMARPRVTLGRGFSGFPPLISGTPPFSGKSLQPSTLPPVISVIRGLTFSPAVDHLTATTNPRSAQAPAFISAPPTWHLLRDLIASQASRHFNPRATAARIS